MFTKETSSGSLEKEKDISLSLPPFFSIFIPSYSFSRGNSEKFAVRESFEGLWGERGKVIPPRKWGESLNRGKKEKRCKSLFCMREEERERLHSLFIHHSCSINSLTVLRDRQITLSPITHRIRQNFFPFNA